MVRAHAQLHSLAIAHTHTHTLASSNIRRRYQHQLTMACCVVCTVCVCTTKCVHASYKKSITQTLPSNLGNTVATRCLSNMFFFGESVLPPPIQCRWIRVLSSLLDARISLAYVHKHDDDGRNGDDAG